MYQQSRQKLRQQAEPLFQEMITSGTLVLPDEPMLINDLLSVSWIVVDFWLNHLSITDQPFTIQNFKHGLRLVVQVWHPYLSPQAWEETKQFIR